jgi:hypothetical protein
MLGHQIPQQFILLQMCRMPAQDERYVISTALLEDIYKTAGVMAAGGSCRLC